MNGRPKARSAIALGRPAVGPRRPSIERTPLATDRTYAGDPPTGRSSLARWAIYHLVSLEALLVLFIYGVNIRLLLPSLPLPETVVFGACSLGIGGLVVLRDGVYLRGLPIVIAGLAFAAWMTASYGWSPSQVLAKEALPFILGVNLWALFAGACIVAGSRERTLRLLVLILLLALLLSVIGNYIYLVHGDFRFYRGGTGEWHHRTYLAWGRIVAVGAAIAMGMAVHMRFGSRKQVAFLVALGSCLCFLLISGARGALLSTIVASLFMLTLHRPRFRDGRMYVPQALLVAALGTFALIFYVTYLIYTGQTTTTLGRFLQLFDQAEDPLLRSGANRFDYFAGAYRAWLAAPIFGQGLKGFSTFFCGYDQPGCGAHNVFLQILADFGLIGFVIFAILIFTVICQIAPRKRQDPLLTILYMICIIVLINSLVATDITSSHFIYFFIGLLALRPPPELDEDDEA
jgi:O-antigen ligase